MHELRTQKSKQKCTCKWLMRLKLCTRPILTTYNLELRMMLDTLKCPYTNHVPRAFPFEIGRGGKRPWHRLVTWSFSSHPSQFQREKPWERVWSIYIYFFFFLLFCLNHFSAKCNVWGRVGTSKRLLLGTSQDIEQLIPLGSLRSKGRAASGDYPAVLCIVSFNLLVVDKPSQLHWGLCWSASFC